MIDLTGVSKVYPVKNGGQVVALDGVNLPAKAATMMMPARLALARSEVHSASA